MLYLDFLPTTPEKFLDRFWSDGDNIVFSSGGAGRRGVIIAEAAGKAAVEKYYEKYGLVQLQLKWSLRLLSITLVIIIILLHKNIATGPIFSILFVIFMMIFAILFSNIRLLLFKNSLRKAYLKGPSHEGLTRFDRIERGYAFSIPALAAIGGLIVFSAAGSFAIHSAIMHSNKFLIHWLGPGFALAFLSWKLIKWIGSLRE